MVASARLFTAPYSFEITDSRAKIIVQPSLGLWVPCQLAMICAPVALSMLLAKFGILKRFCDEKR